MNSMTAPPLQTVVFADLESELWGVAWGSPAGALGLGALTSGSSTTGAAVTFDGSAANDDWQLSADVGALRVLPLTEPVSSERLDGFDQLCEVQGTVVDGREQQVRAVGIRAVRGGIDPANLDSLRDACAWFAPDDGLALTALRPSGARGHQQDLVAGSVFEPGGVMTVVDPRLSTTYSADGLPARAGLELWIETDDEAGEYPRRATGERIGAQIALSADGFDLHAYAMRWHSRGRDGIGAYVLARPR
ncbi:MAG: hypothetical protein QOD66_283 [Solirubrobacteraceae bacterium]|jgi:hypothetical protein|nr:hypothetical protein [Solirubrobacteraceae bacterium]